MKLEQMFSSHSAVNDDCYVSFKTKNGKIIDKKLYHYLDLVGIKIANKFYPLPDNCVEIVNKMFGVNYSTKKVKSHLKVDANNEFIYKGV